MKTILEFIPSVFAVIGAFAILVGLVAGLMTIAQTLMPELVPNFLTVVRNRKRSVGFITRWRMHQLEVAIEDAENVFILQTWFPNLNRQSPVWERASKSPNFKILLLDKSLVDSRLACRSHNENMVENNINIIKTLNVNISTKLYKVIPFGPVYIIDDIIYWGIFTAHSCSMDGPMFKTHRSTWIGSKIEDSLKAIWASSELIYSHEKD